jgi:hypothetical protein
MRQIYQLLLSRVDIEFIDLGNDRTTCCIMILFHSTKLEGYHYGFSFVWLKYMLIGYSSCCISNFQFTSGYTLQMEPFSLERF